MIEARGVGARAGRFALRDVSFVLPRGAWGIVLGPTGAGKTTLLETIAGVRRASGGCVVLRGVDVTREPPERRGLGMVYQHGYLFPHLSVERNVAYGTAEASYTCDLVERFGMAELRGRPVDALSGGERQVVALVRALAPRPDLLLLDEPFGALDPCRRTRVRSELHALQREQQLTVLHATHDFAEAGALGDLALLLEGGRLVQAAPPKLLFRRPGTPAAAEFLGAENVYAGVAECAEGSAECGRDVVMRFRAGPLVLTALGDGREGPAHAVVRGEDVVLAREHRDRAAPRDALAGTVLEVAADGIVARVTVDVRGVPLVAVITTETVRELRLAAGAAVVASVHPTAVHLC